jgi:hypothetical protein
VTERLYSALIVFLVTACSAGPRAESNACTERLGGEILFVGEARCMATLPQEEISGYWVSGHEYSVFYANKQDIKHDLDRDAPWLFVSSDAEAAVKDKVRPGEWQVFAIRFIGTKSSMRGIYGPGPFKAGVLVLRILEINEVAPR